MNYHLRGKTALLTSATAGVGLAAAHLLAQEGATVYLHGRTLAAVEQAGERVRAAVPRAALRPVVADLLEATSVLTLLAAVPRVDILVDSLGLDEPGSATEPGGVRLARHYFPLMLAQNWGRIIYVAKDNNQPAPAIRQPLTTQAVNHCLLALLAAGSRVTVNAVLLHSSVGAVPALAGQPERGSTPEEVAHLLAYVASPLAAASSGEAWHVATEAATLVRHP